MIQNAPQVSGLQAMVDRTGEKGVIWNMPWKKEMSSLRNAILPLCKVLRLGGIFSPLDCTCLCYLCELTFSWCIVHCWTTGNFSSPATLAAGGQVLCHSWMHRTLVCGTDVKDSSAGLLTVKWIQSLLVFSWGFHPPQRVINLYPAF